MSSYITMSMFSFTGLNISIEVRDKPQNGHISCFRECSISVVWGHADFVKDRLWAQTKTMLHLLRPVPPSPGLRVLLWGNLNLNHLKNKV